MVRLSEIGGRRIFDAQSQFIGTASDIIIDPTEGRVKFLVKEKAHTILGLNRDQAKQFMRKNFIPVEKLNAIGNVIIVSD
jgi:sporulation protein YlmC with PRC-barrel domain